MESESLARSVQEFLVTGQDGLLLQKHLSSNANIDVKPSLPTLHIPAIDLRSLASSAPISELENFRSALVSCGCIQFINHGMASSFLDQVHQITKDFFALPMEDKKKLSRTLEEDQEGYGGDSVKEILDWSDRLFLTVRPRDQIKFQFWPDNPQNFRQVLQELTDKLESLAEIVLKAMAKALNLEENIFLDEYGENPTMIARFNFYPLCPWSQPTIAAKQHTDTTAFTFLFPDNQVDGLEAMKDDQWFKVPIIPNALLLNVGDQIEILSNGKFKAVLHRVVTNPERGRASLAMFCLPEKDKEIGPIQSLISKDNPSQCKKIANISDLYLQHYEDGTKLIDAVKL